MSYRRAYERNRRLKNKCHTHKCIWYDEEQNKYYKVFIKNYKKV